MLRPGTGKETFLNWGKESPEACKMALESDPDHLNSFAGGDLQNFLNTERLSSAMYMP